MFLLISTRIPMRYIFSTDSLYTYSIERYFDFAARAGSDGIRIRVDNRWDTTHLGTWNLEPLDVSVRWQEKVVRWQEKVRHVHLSNFNGREHRRPEDGHLCLDLLVARMAADGYGGAISFELHPDALRAGAPDDVTIELMTNSLAACRTRGNTAATDQQEIGYPHPAHALF